MSMRAPFVCGHCGKTHPSGERCAVVARMAAQRKARSDQKRPNAGMRGYDKPWEREAKAFLSLPENARCASCGARATVVMHVESIRARPDLRMVRSNWRAGCQRCNAIDAAEERSSWKGKRT